MLYDIDINYGRQNEIIIFDKLKLFFNDTNLKELSYYMMILIIVIKIVQYYAN